MLRKNLDLRRRYVECFDGDYDEPYDALLDDYEPGMKTAEVACDLRLPQGAPGAARQRVRWRRAGPATGCAHVPARAPEAVRARGGERFGFDDQAWRLDPTVHPFASGGGTQDIRITTRYFEDNLDGLFATMHEFGHGLYEHQVDGVARADAARARRLARPARVAEPHVGEPRRALAAVLALLLPAAPGALPDALQGYDAERWYREVNAVEPSLIRVEADEATYNLHIILRFELEQELLAGSFPLEQLPEEWNRRMWEYLGIEVPDDTHGVLQDTHWAAGAIGYFSTYALGNLISAQIWEKVLDDLPDLHDEFEQGEFGRFATGCASGCTATAASSRRRRSSNASSARRGSTRSRTCATCVASSATSTACRSVLASQRVAAD